MSQILIRVLWPLVQQPLAAWPCEYHAGTDEPSQVAVLPLSEALQVAAASQPADAAVVTVILPGELAIREQVRLPARGQRQALQALPFVVEEQLADDIEKVHLAVGSRQPDGRWPVIVVDLAMMVTLTDCCEQAGVRLKAVYVDGDMLPLAPGRLSVLMHGERVLLNAAQTLAAVDLPSASSLIHLLVGETVFSQVSIRHEEGNEQQALLAQQLSTEYRALGDTQVAVETVTGCLSALLSDSLSSGAINLLQGAFTVRQPAGVLPWWQVAAAVFLFAWIGQLGLQLSSGWYLDRAATVLEQSAEDQYRKLFPDARQVSDPRKRLESKLSSAGDAGSEASFVWLFGTSIQALKNMPANEGLTIEQLRFEAKRGQLELELKAKSIDQLDQYKQALGKAGLVGRISSANDGDGGISGRMQIGTGAGS